jgi:hypothetical protein|tara:strand:- start:47 stop:436 length:390 start_codon:yes stop_codon:yes gene_type:complete
MGGIKVDLLKQLKQYAPVDRIVLLYERGEDFIKELANYMTGGVVIANPKFFMMMKAIDSTKPPKGQWGVSNPDCWYARWVAGDNALGDMFDQLDPLPYLMFRRLTENGETKMRKYSWDRAKRLANRITI